MTDEQKPEEKKYEWLINYIVSDTGRNFTWVEKKYSNVYTTDKPLLGVKEIEEFCEHQEQLGMIVIVDVISLPIKHDRYYEEGCGGTFDVG